MKKNIKLSVFNYTDYRAYLVDFIAESRKTDPDFSYRRFAKKAGYNSSGLLIDVINRRTNIQPEVVAKFCKGLSLVKSEKSYFENLVKFNQAKTHDAKNNYFAKMVSLLSGKLTTIQSNDYVYFSKWYYPAIRESLSVCNFRGNYTELAQMLRPAITVQQAKSAISFLLKNGFIKIDDSGRYVACHQSITTEKEVKSINVANFQRNMMCLAIEAIDRFSPEERNIASLTFSVSAKSMEDIKAEMEASRARIRSIIENSNGDEMICQYNVQLFPLSGRITKS
ncbi:MAG: TIGR02147 family protein [Fibrobacteres bacterium]|nr:TIGR02147 family protein [Fibrobacterota bacterium]